jgi:hypothetical protein
MTAETVARAFGGGPQLDGALPGHDDRKPSLLIIAECDAGAAEPSEAA